MNRWELEDLHPDLDVRDEINEGRQDDAARAARREREALAFERLRELEGPEAHPYPDPMDNWDDRFPPPPF